MTKISSLSELDITAGVMPSTDATAFDIPCWTDSYGIRFDPTTGRPRKIGGWTSNAFNYGNTIDGTTRTIYSATINSKVYTILGTNTYLYSLIGSQLLNITPLQTISVAAANSLATFYATLANNPIATVDGSNYLTITDANASLYQVNDTYTLSGSTGFNGIPAGDINADHVVRGVSGTTLTIRVATAATATGSGGGAAVVAKSGLIRLTSAAHGLLDGYRVKIEGAATFGGIADTDINNEFIIRNVATNTFDFMTEGTASSSVSGGGGASTVYYPQIDAGNLNQGSGQGYGMGLYGYGLYGTALVSETAASYPRIWFCDRFGENIVMTAGNGSEVYSWDGNGATAPAIVSGAPTDVNYLFVSDNILVTFGHGTENNVFASDQGDITQWTSSSTNQVYEDTVEGAGRLISHCPVDGYNLIFTENQTYTFKYIGLPLIWQTQILDANIGIIAPFARVSVNGIAYWMGQDNFYMFRGGKVEIIPSNITGQASILRYVFDDLNYSQRFKFFAWYNEAFDEIWFHYASASSNECNRIARYSRKLGAWCPDIMDRTAGEAPVISLSNPRLANVGALYTHESGNDADGLPLPWGLTTRKYMTGTNTGLNISVVPDMTATGTVNCVFRMYNYPQSQTARQEVAFDVTGETENLPVRANGRFWQLEIGGEELGQSFLMGQWLVDQQPAGRAP